MPVWSLRNTGYLKDCSFETAVRIAISGNIIDLGVTDSYDIDTTLIRVMTQPFAINDLALFRKRVSASNSIFYLADNADETMFDWMLIELNKLVTYLRSKS